MENIYDFAVIGGGPGGYTAALYAARAGLKTLVIEKLAAGGQLALAETIDNYPGFAQGIPGFTLGERMRQGAERFGVKTLGGAATALDLRSSPRRIEVGEETVYAHTLAYAAGASPRTLGLAGEEALTGKGVHYCASCDGFFYRGRTVAVVGGGNSAVADALQLSRTAEKVYLIHRRDALRADRVETEALRQAANVEILWSSAVTRLRGAETLEGLSVQNLKTGGETELPVAGLFVSIGRRPETDLVQGQLVMDSSGYILADETTRTNIPGVYAVGDVRQKPVRQIVTATADGAVAAHFAQEYLAQVHH